MITFGLTGGIASGKSTVTKTFRTNNIPIVDADIIARELVVKESFGWGMIRAMFGHEYLNEDETINRSKLGKLVFSDKKAMYNLNAIMAPIIEAESNRQIKELHKDHAIVGYDAALIIEQGNADKFRPLIVVGCDPEIQLDRLMSRNGLTAAEAMDRINAQMTFKEKANVADYIINTSGSLEDSFNQTIQIINFLQTEKEKGNG
jgi:dephospho-CoA kinase